MKKILALVACLSLVASLAIGGSIAYLTDRDSAANVFSMGDVAIKLSEVFESGVTLLPNQEVEKKPVITNTGKNDAWVWATIAYPTAFTGIDDLVMIEQEGNGGWKSFGNEELTQEVNGVECRVFTYLYETALENGDRTTPLMTSVTLNKFVDIDPEGNLYHVEGGVATDLGWNIHTNGDPVIYVSAYAIQEEGFETVEEAYAAYNVQWGDNGAEWGDPNEPVVSTQIANDAGELAALLAEDMEGEAIALNKGVDYGTQEIRGSLKDVTIVGAENAQVEFNITSGAKLENVTFTELNVNNVEGSAAYVDGGIVNIDAGASVKNLVIENSDLTGSGGRSSIVGCSEPSAEVTIRNCSTDGTKYVFYASAPVKKLNIENCDLKNHSSWIVMENSGDSVGAELTITGNYFTNCTGGIAKYLGSSQPDGAKTVFTNNTLTNSTGHDGSDAKWFTIPGSTSTITVSGNTLDGADWTPGTDQGLGK